MKKIFVLFFALAVTNSLLAQTKSKTVNLNNNKPADHFMIQLANNSWIGAPDSVNSRIKGFSRSANVYVMYDKKFKSNPKFSIAAGVGVGTSNIYFDKMNVVINANKSKLPFLRSDTGNNFKKYKLSSTFLEIPLELRFTSNTENPNKAIKGALGIKVGTLINVHTKGKGVRNSGGATTGNYTEKISGKGYFNGTRIALTGRVGYGLYSLFGAYSLTNVFKDGVAADTKTFQIGIAISGL